MEGRKGRRRVASTLNEELGAEIEKFRLVFPSTNIGHADTGLPTTGQHPSRSPKEGRRGRRGSGGVRDPVRLSTSLPRERSRRAYCRCAHLKSYSVSMASVLRGAGDS
ncbi:uncharacterized protein LOC135195426 [Macrobrachium nipponense]|uniref:uncharacterized protein LOC135195426 n=1 Tax=Macrobrachium nipponense TaxID=159736 RepID=UPI0030C886E7